VSGRAIVERYAAATAANDSALMRECLAPDYVGRYPQSGEVIRGIENRLAIGENFPGQEERKLSSTFGEIRGSDEPFVNQFVNGRRDGPVPFHYPAPGYDADLELAAS